MALRTITVQGMATAFCAYFISKYGPEKKLRSYNETQFALRLFQNVCQLMGLNDILTFAYHPQTTGQVERYNRTLFAMIQKYVNEHQNDLDLYFS